MNLDELRKDLIEYRAIYYLLQINQLNTEGYIRGKFLKEKFTNLDIIYGDGVIAEGHGVRCGAGYLRKVSDKSEILSIADDESEIYTKLNEYKQKYKKAK
ncbi:MAG: hypothetical protein Q4A60_04395 [Pasteurellaceae bacterium]|nr:hypothetical protein [Pasteurellaceae bacterium]